MSPPLFLILLIPLTLAIGAVWVASVLAKRVGVLVPFAFVVTYVLGVGAIILVNIGVFHIVDPKFRHHWVSAWLELYWPLWTTFHAPTAISALLACWFSRPSTRKDAIRLLGLYLLLILFAVQVAWLLDAGVLYQLGAFVLLSTIFFATAYWKRAAHSAPDDPVLRGNGC